jgi:hypothetical protein
MARLHYKYFYFHILLSPNLAKSSYEKSSIWLQLRIEKKKNPGGEVL